MVDAARLLYNIDYMLSIPMSALANLSVLVALCLARRVTACSYKLSRRFSI